VTATWLKSLGVDEEDYFCEGRMGVVRILQIHALMYSYVNTRGLCFDGDPCRA
jgi:hypothetical protein